MSPVVAGSDGELRCGWSSVAPEFEFYHDNEWGFPVADDFKLFEKLCLEGFQSGLSWRTILAKRENFRKAFHGFDYRKISKFDDDDVARLLTNEGIVRHRGKIEAVINNAKKAKEAAAQHGSLAAFIWQFESSDSKFSPQTRSKSDESHALSKELKKLGWKFVGPTTVYAFMQAMGLINDHSHDCFVREKVEKARAKFKRPC